MVAAVYSLLPKEEAEVLLFRLSDDVWKNRIPKLSDIPLVNNPENVLSRQEMQLIDTGLDDLVLRATIECMPDPLRFGLRLGYSLELNESEVAKYNLRQFGWMQRAAWLLGERLGRAPTKTEFYEDYFGSGTALTFNLLNLLSNPDRAVRNGDFRMIEGMPMLHALYGGPGPMPSGIATIASPNRTKHALAA